MKEKIEQLKKKYKFIYAVGVDDRKAILKKPDRHILSFASHEAMTAQGKLDPIKYGESIMRQCWLDGDQEWIQDDEWFLPVLEVVHQITERAQAYLEKL